MDVHLTTLVKSERDLSSKEGLGVFINPRLLLHGVSVHEESTPMLTSR
jgi:hypothetical protein